MTWEILFHDEFLPEFLDLSPTVQDEILAYTKLLEVQGPLLRRPHADTLKGSQYKNMKELRFYADEGVWRIAFAFDPEQKAILLIAGNKAGINEKRLYKQLIIKADKRYESHLQELKKKENKNMTKKLSAIMAELTPERQAKIEARAQELILQNMTLEDIRKARELTQECMSEMLGVHQDSFCKIEKRTDILLSTLRSYVKAMGGELKLVAEFPDRPPVIISALGELED